MKGQTSFLIKSFFIIIASILFIIVILNFSSFQKSTIQEKELSNFKMEVTNTLQKIVNDKNCLAYAHNESSQKIVIDIKKLRAFVSTYSDTEPECAKAIDFDYNIKVTQYPKSFNLYPGETCREVEKMSDFLCTDYSYGGQFIYVACNYLPSECQGICEACGEFDSGRYSCDSSWGCGDDPLTNCPYTGSCSVSQCPYRKPPDGICCIFRLCPVDACEKVIVTGAGGHPTCYLAYGKCDLTKCKSVSGVSYFHSHCSRGVIEVCEPSHEYININIPMETVGFGVGFGTSGFSPQKARSMEVELSLPITIRQNDTFSAEGVIYIYAVKGEIETLSSLMEDFCEKAVKTRTNLQFSKELHFSFPVNYSSGKLCIPDACKVVKCFYPINFQNIDKEGDYPMTFSFDLSSQEISVRK